MAALENTVDATPPAEEGGAGEEPGSQAVEGGAPAAGGGGGGGGGAAEEPGSKGNSTASGAASQDEKQRLLQLMHGYPQGEEEGKPNHKFWNTQPVPEARTVDAPNGPINVQTVEDIRPEPFNLPAGFVWSAVQILDDAQANEVYCLLRDHYVEDDNNMFRFDYSVNFLRWALTVPGYDENLHLGLRSSKSNKLMAFISGIPAKMSVHHGGNVEMVEINFLCVHKKLRSKRLAPVLIKEVTRRVNLKGIFQAVYTAGITLPQPVASCRYWHRSINPKKLIDIGFSHLQERMTMTRTVKLYKLPDGAENGVIPMEPQYLESARELLNEYLSQFKLAPSFTAEEFAHWFTPQEGVVDCFVKVNAEGKVTDMGSFYHLPSSILKSTKYSTLYAAFSFYNVCTTLTRPQLFRDLLIMAKSKGMDVFNALDLMQNAEILTELKFAIGGGSLQYYLYNWQCPLMEPPEIGLVLM